MPPSPTPEIPILDPRKMFAWGILCGTILALVILSVNPYYEDWRALRAAETQVKVNRILGTCK